MAAVPSIDIADTAVVLAVSGGLDSMMLLHAAVRSTRQRTLLHVVHVNHALRGADSAADEHFVRTSCAALSVHCHTVARPINPAAAGIEASAREARYAVLAEVARTVGASMVLTGHTADDQAETMLLHVGRGAGLDGMRGIPEYRPLCEGVTLHRPFLRTPRRVLRDAAQAWNVQWREDASNADLRFLRNRIRHEVMPVLQTIFGLDLAERMANTAHVLNDARLVIAQAVEAVASRCVRVESNDVHVDVAILRDQSIGLQRELMRFVLRNPPLGCPSHTSTIDRVVDLIHAPVGKQAPLSSTHVAIRDHGGIVITPRHRPLPHNVAIAGPGAYVAGQVQLDVSVADVGTVAMDYQPTVAFMDTKALQGSLHWRTWADGDRMQPLGLDGTALVSDLLAGAKLSHAHRRLATVLCDDAGIVWLCGVRLADRVKIKPSTRQLYIVRITAPYLPLPLPTVHD